jgi:hypothetical protein
MRLVHLTESAEERRDIVPLNVVAERMSENLLSCDSVVMVQLE